MTTNYHDCNTIFYERTCKLFGDMRQQRIADMTGLAQGKISDILSYRDFPERYQNKKPSAEMVYKIAKAFNVSTDYLLGLTDYKTNNKATKELCDTLGLSEEAIGILSADPTSAIPEHMMRILPPEYQNHNTNKLRKSTIEGHSKTVRYVVNRMIDEYVDIYSHIEYATLFDASLLDYLRDFYEYVDTENLEIFSSLREDEKEIANRAEGVLGDSVHLFGNTKNGNRIARCIRTKDLLIDSAINEIITKLNNIKHENAQEYNREE